MAAIQALYAEKSSDTNATSTAWVEVISIPATSFIAGKKYLLIFNGYHEMLTSSASDARVRYIHGTVPTNFTDGQASYELTAGLQKTCISYMTVFTQPATAEKVSIEISASAATTHTCHMGQIFALNLTDNLTENVDWFFSEVTTDYITTVNFADTDPTEGAAVTFTPNGTDSWLLLSNAQIANVQTAVNHQMRINDSVAGQLVAIDVEGEDNVNDIRSYLLTQTVTPTAAAHTFATQFSHRTTAVRSNGSRIFALNLAKFDQRVFSYSVAEETPATAPTWTTTRTVSMTPNVTGNWLILGYYSNDVGSILGDEVLQTRLQHNNSGAFVSEPDYTDDAPAQDGWDVTDVLPFTIFLMRSLTSGASRTANLDVRMSSTTGVLRVQERCLTAFSMELPGAPPAFVPAWGVKNNLGAGFTSPGGG